MKTIATTLHPGNGVTKNALRVAALVAILGLGVAQAWADTATATFINTEGDEIGTANLIQTLDGVLIQLHLFQVSTGTHALHIHAVGKCEPPSFVSADGHFNPTQKQHGLLNEAGAHGGDLPNIHIPENKTLRLEVLAPELSLWDRPRPLLDADGSALVIHATKDDYRTDPTGAAGPRIACGVITGQEMAAQKDGPEGSGLVRR